MRKPRGGQILANRVIGPREVLGGGDRRVPAKGRGRTEPHRGRSGASWIWSTPLHTGASEGEFRSGYALTPSPSHSKNISLFTERRTSERTVSEDGYSSFLFNPLWGFPVVAAGILFVVDRSINGLAWTASKRIAYWFATRYDLANPAVFEVTVPEQEILAYINDRNEQEFIFVPSEDLRPRRLDPSELPFEPGGKYPD